MTVIATFKDGTTMEIIISEAAMLSLLGPKDAIELAKRQLKPEEVAQVDTWEIEEEFL